MYFMPHLPSLRTVLLVDPLFDSADGGMETGTLASNDERPKQIGLSTRKEVAHMADASVVLPTYGGTT